MELSQAKDIIDSIKDYALKLSPWNWGETLLGPNIFEIIRHGHDAGIYTELHSHMSARVENLGEKLVESGLDSLFVSFDGLDQVTNETYRRRIDHDLLLENVREVVAARSRMGSKTPRVDCSMLVFRHNEHQIPRLQEMKELLGVDSFETRRACIYEESFVPENPEYHPLQDFFSGTCSFLYCDLTVESDGGISPCCTNISRKWDIGIAEDLKDLHAFWNRPVLQAMRSCFANFHAKGGAAFTGYEDEILCQHCSYVSDCRASNHDGRLSPQSPTLVAEGRSMNHGIMPSHFPVGRG